MNKKNELSKFKKVAVIQTAYLGDIVLTLPLAQAIKNSSDDNTVVFVTTPAGAQIGALSDAVDKIVTYDKRGMQRGLKGILDMSRQIRDMGVDCIIAPHRSLRTTLVSYLSRAEYTVGFNKNSFSFLYRNTVRYDIEKHEIDRDLSLLQAFDGYEDILKKGIVPEISFSFEDRNFVNSQLAVRNINDEAKIAALAPGSVWATKRWKKDYFTQLAKMLNSQGINCLIIGSKEDKPLCDEIAFNSGSFSLAGETTIPQTIYLLSLCKILVTNDSAPTHFAGLVNCPTITIYGPTSPRFGFSPRGPHDRILQNNTLKCKPCHIHGRQKCPVKTHECMVSVLPDHVFGNCMEVISETEA